MISAPKRGGIGAAVSAICGTGNLAGSSKGNTMRIKTRSQILFDAETVLANDSEPSFVAPHFEWQRVRV